MNHDEDMPSADELNLLSEVIGQVARRLSREERDDFAQTVQVRLLERRYDIFRRFEGRSSIRTYLKVVVARILLDWRNECYGKWRPSAAAVRMGREAIRLDRLINRDGFSTEEALEIVRPSSAAMAQSLRSVADALPRRSRRRFVPLEQLWNVSSPAFIDPVDAEQQRRSQCRIRRELANTLRRLPLEDRQLLTARFQQGRSVRALAQSLNLDPKKLYRRYEAMIRKVRSQLATGGVSEVDPA